MVSKKTGGWCAGWTTTCARRLKLRRRGLGSQNAVCGGGRYDGLVELLGGPPTKGIGFAIGEDRLILSLQESGKAPALGTRPRRVHCVDGREGVRHGGERG